MHRSNVSFFLVYLCALNRKLLAFVAFIFGGGVLLTWAQFDTNAIDTAYRSAIAKINERKEQVKSLSARSVGSEFPFAVSVISHQT